MRPMILEDAAHLLELNRDPEVVRFTGDSVMSSLSDAVTIIQYLSTSQFKNHKTGRFALFLKDGTFLGFCGLKTHADIGVTDLGFRLRRAFWGQGYATEAAREQLRYGMEDLGLTKIVAHVLPANQASLRVLSKLGMTFMGLGRDGHFPSDYILYEITNQQYSACRNS